MRIITDTMKNLPKHTKQVEVETKQPVIKQEGEDTKITVPISSTTKDREEDNIKPEGLENIVNQINSDTTIVRMFPNHGLDEFGHYSYRFQDIMGEWEEAKIENKEDKDLAIATATLREGDENAEELLDLLEQNISVGFSIGFGWDEEKAEENEDGGMSFEDLDLMEISPVGIPSNPDAEVQFGMNVAKQLKAKGVEPNHATKKEIKEAINSMSEKEENEEEEEEEEEESTEGQETKQEYDVEPMIIIDEVADHFDLQTDDLADFLNEDDFDFDLRARASATADIVGVESGKILDMYEQLAEAEETEGEDGEDGEDEEEEEESISESLHEIADYLDVEVEEVIQALAEKFDSYDECVQHMLDQGYDRESAENICGDICETQDDNPDETSESEELREKVEELERELKKVKSQNREADRKGMNPTDKNSEDLDTDNDKDEKPKRESGNVEDEALAFEVNED